MQGKQSIEDFTLELNRGSELSLALALAVMMFSVALSLKPSSFSFLRSAPRPFFVGIFAQLLALPLVTLVICYTFEPSPSIALGMIIVSCCPGGNVSNILVLLARGNTALSVSLTASSSLTAAFLTPFAIVLWSSFYSPTAQLLTSIEFNKFDFLVQTASILALPLLLGLIVNVYVSKLAELIRKPLVVCSSGFLVIIIIAGATQYWSTFIAIGLSVFSIVVAHNFSAFCLGLALAHLADVTKADRRAITFEVGIQNSSLGIVILLTQLGGLGGALAVVCIWGVWHIIAGLTLVIGFRCIDMR